MNLVSVIIPIYNIEDYVKDCIDSVIEQTYSNLEIILVDDGSTDKSSDICDTYLKKDSRVVVIHQTHQGLSVARNSGLDYAKGDWIIFVDGDDYIHPDMIRVLLETAVKNDVLYVRCNEVHSSESRKTYSWENGCYEDYSIVRMSSADEMRNILEKRVLISVWGSIYHKSILDKLRFPEGYVFEDHVFTPAVLQRVSAVIHVQSDLYFYRYRASSITNSERIKHTKDYCEMIFQENKLVCSYFPELQNLSCERFCSDYINQYNRLSGKAGNYYKKWMRDNHKKYMDVVPVSVIMNWQLSFYQRLIVLGCKFAFRISCFVKHVGILLYELSYPKQSFHGYK